MTRRTLSAAALATLMLSTAAFARGPTPKITSGTIKTNTQTTQQIIQKIYVRSPSQARVSGSKGTVRRGGCEEWACGTSNGTKLTAIVQERGEAIEPVVSTVTLPSGETVALR